MYYDQAGIRQAAQNSPYSSAFSNNVQAMPASTNSHYIINTSRNDKELRYTKDKFLKEFLYDVPLETVQKLIEQHLPEYVV